MTYGMQAGQEVAAGNVGGYSATMQDVGGKRSSGKTDRQVGAHTGMR